MGAIFTVPTFLVSRQHLPWPCELKSAILVYNLIEIKMCPKFSWSIKSTKKCNYSAIIRNTGAGSNIYTDILNVMEM